MGEIKQNREATLFRDDVVTGKQAVLIDMDDSTEPWIIVNHCGEELSMSLTNWDYLVELVEKAKKEITS